MVENIKPVGLPFSLRLRMLFLSRAFTPNQAASVCALSSRTVALWIRGQSAPIRGAKTDALAKALHVPPEALDRDATDVTKPFVIRVEGKKQWAELDDGCGAPVRTEALPADMYGGADLTAFQKPVEIFHMEKNRPFDGSSLSVKPLKRKSSSRGEAPSLPAGFGMPAGPRAESLSDLRSDALGAFEKVIQDLPREDIEFLKHLVDCLPTVVSALPEEEKTRLHECLTSGTEKMRSRAESGLAFSMAWLVGVVNRSGLQGLAVPWVKDRNLYSQTLDADVERIQPLTLRTDVMEFGEEAADALESDGLLPEGIRFEDAAKALGHLASWLQKMQPDVSTAEVSLRDVSFFTEYLEKPGRFSARRLGIYRAVFFAWLQYCGSLRN